MLNSYVSEEEQSSKNLEQINANMEQYKLRTTGVKTVEELKREVQIFLDKNDVPEEIRDELTRECDSFNENTDLYQASIHLDNIMNEYQQRMMNDHQNAIEQVRDIKSDLISGISKNLSNVGISLSGDEASVLESIKDEHDVYKLKNNADRVVEYYEGQALSDDAPTLELPIEKINSAIENPGSETLLNEARIEEHQEAAPTDNLENTENEASKDNFENTESNNIEIDKTVEIKNDGSISLQENANNPESMNFVAMMTLALVVNQSELNLDKGLDVKIIKDKREENNYQVLFGNFSNKENYYNSILFQKIQKLVTTYNPSISYIKALSTYSPELALSLQIVDDHILKQPGSFKMAIKNNGNSYNMKFGFDDEYQEVVDTFLENNVYTTQDINNDAVCIINDNGNKDQLVQLTQILDGLQFKEKLGEQSLALENQYQKKLILPLDNAANVNQIFLTTVLVTELLLVLLGIYFIFS